MSQALNATGRPIYFLACEWGIDDPWLWMNKYVLVVVLQCSGTYFVLPIPSLYVGMPMPGEQLAIITVRQSGWAHNVSGLFVRAEILHSDPFEILDGFSSPLIVYKLITITILAHR
jgi:hypothetical protein